MNRHPDRRECLKILNEYGTPDHVIGHCCAVADVAVRTGSALNENGYHLDTELIMSAAMLHDMARKYDRHWEVAAEWCRTHGLQQEADIIKVHMFYPAFSAIDKVNETDIVCLGDRVVKFDKYVGLDERIDYIINKIPRKEKDIKIIMEKKAEAARFIEDIERITGRSFDSIAEGK